MNTVTTETILEAYERLKPVVVRTPLVRHAGLSERYQAEVYLKREDLQSVRSYKVRGAYNKMAQLTPEERARGVVCASAGNHAQGVAKSCAELGVKGAIFMPMNTPRQKVERVRVFGGEQVDIRLVGDTFDASFAAAKEYAQETVAVLVHPFDDPDVIAGQGTVAVEVLEDRSDLDVLVLPVGGGGLMGGMGTYAKSVQPSVRVVGVEPTGAASMHMALKAGHVVTLETLDKFVDGVAVRTVGEHTFALAQKVADSIELVPEGLVCSTMIQLYQEDGIVAEPAGALSVAALEEMQADIKGKTVVCVISGGNNDISRYAEVLERSLVYKGLKHYFIIEFAQRPGALKLLLNEALGETDDITLFEYIKKNNRESGPALVGIELARREDFEPLTTRMRELGFSFEVALPDSPLYCFVV